MLGKTFGRHPRWLVRVIALAWTLAVVPAGFAAEPDQQQQNLDEQVQDLKGEVLRIDDELQRLEERLVYPAGGQFSLFLSVERADEFRLDSVDVRLDGDRLTSHVYGYRELEALLDGGVQRLHIANVPVGRHRLGVTIRGVAGDTEYEVVDAFEFDKTTGPHLLEMRVVDTRSRQPEVELVARP